MPQVVPRQSREPAGIAAIPAERQARARGLDDQRHAVALRAILADHGICEFLRRRSWVRIGSAYAQQMSHHAFRLLAAGAGVMQQAQPVGPRRLDLIRLGSEREIKAQGLVRQEPKDYVIRDGDILNIRFSV